MLTQVQNAATQVPAPAWAVLLALTTLAFGYRVAAKTGTNRRPGDSKKRRTLIGFASMGFVVTLGFALSANTSIVFAEARLHMQAPWTLTVGLALEGIVLGLTLHSWATGDKGSARVAYLLVFAQAIGAFEVVRFQHEDIGTALVRIVGPVMLAYGLHKLLGLEAKLGRIEIKSDGLVARWWRDRLKRTESWLGIGSRGADAQAISRRNAQDKLVALATLGKPLFMSKRAYEKALMRAGDAAFHGLDDTLDQLGTEMDITTRIDRMGAFKALPSRAEKYTLKSVRRAAPLGSVLNTSPDDVSALTSEGAPERALGELEANPGEAQASAKPTVGADDRRRIAFDLYFDLRGTGPAPSQNAFEKAWRDAGHGLKTDDIRALYKDVHSKVTGNNA